MTPREKRIVELQERVKEERSQLIIEPSADPLDDALASSTRLRAAARLNQAVKELQELVEMDEGEYGVCRGCGEEIEEKRLRALPLATLCVRCKMKEEGDVG